MTTPQVQKRFIEELGRELSGRALAIYDGTSGLPEGKRAAYIAMWKGEQPEKRNARPKAEPTQPCPHLGDPVPGMTVGCKSCGGLEPMQVYSCALHRLTVIENRAPAASGVHACRWCDHNPENIRRRERIVTRAAPPESPPPPPRFPEVATRHLIYHVYPVAGNGAWQWNVDQLVRRLDLFNGKIVVAVARDPVTGRGTDPMGADNNRHFAPCDSFADVVARFGAHAARVEFLEFENDPQLREVATLEPLLARIPAGDDHACLYAQAKGATRPVGHVSRRWTAALYETLLDYWPAVERVLAAYPLAGSFLKEGRGWEDHESKSQWHYSGSWFWFRTDALLSKDWRRIEQWWGGIETYPSNHFPLSDAGCVFHRGPVPAVKLYNVEYWDQVVTPALVSWRRAHEGERWGSCRQLNYGCGPHYFPGWHNTDVTYSEVIRPDEVVEAGQPLPWSDGSFSRAYLGHVLEHIRWEDVPTLLAEVRRVIQPGGEALVVGPDFRVALEKLLTNPDRAAALSHVWEITEDHSHYQRESRDRDWEGARHQWNCYAERVAWAMTRAGFEDVRIIPLDPAVLGAGANPWPVVDYTNTSQCAVLGRAT